MRTPLHLAPSVLLLALAALLPGCETIEDADRSTGRFRTNDTRGTFLDSKSLEVVRASWVSIAPDLTSQSRVSKANQQWTMDFIANVESEGVSPCRNLSLKSLQQLEPKPFRAQTPDLKPLAFAPGNYMEQWSVEACGKTRLWRLFEETSDPKNPFRVILWSAG